MIYLQMEVLHLADVFENFVRASTEESGINPLYSYSAHGYTRNGFKMTYIKSNFIKNKQSLFSLEIIIRGGTSSFSRDRNVESDENTKLVYIDANC